MEYVDEQGVDVWPILLSQSSQSPREFLPTTEHSLIWQQPQKRAVKEREGTSRAATPILWKLITAAGRNGWYPPNLGYNSSGKLEADEKRWPCVGTSPSPYFGGKCTVCSSSKPCLFNLLEDEGERVNLASQQPAIVAKLSTLLNS